MRRLALVLPLVGISACGSCAGGDEKPAVKQEQQQQQQMQTVGEAGAGGSRFARPFVPGQANTAATTGTRN